MTLAPDLRDYISRAFRPEDRDEAIALVAGAVLHDGRHADVRCQRAAVVGAAGSMAALARLIALLRVDYRDVILAGEYETHGGALRQVRDLGQPLDVDPD